MLLAKSRRRRSLRASGGDGGQPRGARDRPGPLGEPGAEPDHVQGGTRQQMLEPRWGQTAIAGLAQAAGGDALGDGSFHAGPGGVLRGEGGRRLAGARGPQRQVLGLRLEGEPTRPPR